MRLTLAGTRRGLPVGGMVWFGEVIREGSHKEELSVDRTPSGKTHKQYEQCSSVIAVLVSRVMDYVGYSSAA